MAAYNASTVIFFYGLLIMTNYHPFRDESLIRARYLVALRISSLSIMAVAMATRHRRMTMQAMKHLGSGHQYCPMMEHVTYMVAIDIGNGQRQDPDNDERLWPTTLWESWGGGGQRRGSYVITVFTMIVKRGGEGGIIASQCGQGEELFSGSLIDISENTILNHSPLLGGKPCYGAYYIGPGGRGQNNYIFCIPQECTILCTRITKKTVPLYIWCSSCDLDICCTCILLPFGSHQKLTIHNWRAKITHHFT